MASIRSYYPNILCIFKKLKLKGENEYLKLSKLIDLNAENLYLTHEYNSRKILIQDNSSKR